MSHTGGYRVCLRTINIHRSGDCVCFIEFYRYHAVSISAGAVGSVMVQNIIAVVFMVGGLFLMISSLGLLRLPDFWQESCSGEV